MKYWAPLAMHGSLCDRTIYRDKGRAFRAQELRSEEGKDYMPGEVERGKEKGKGKRRERRGNAPGRESSLGDLN